MVIRARKDRAVDELVGLCRGLIADGSLVLPEVQYLRNWLAGHVQFVHEYPFNVIAERICDAIGDDELDADEERDLITMCQLITGNESVLGPVAAASMASGALPLTDPPPEICFPGCNFVVTGVFDYGPRVAVTHAIAERGGFVQRDVLNSTNVLVVGNIGSAAWMHSTHGRKIEKAAQRGFIQIINEGHWARHL